MAADEGDFITLLIASERVAGWVDIIRGYRAGTSSLPLTKQAVRDLVQALQQNEAYTEEARRAGAVPLLTGLLKHTEDEELLNDISDALSALSGLMASSGKVRTFYYGGTPVVLKEGALGDGVGAKVWTVAHTFCREMASHPDIVRGKQVLEIGSGCGACGILAAKLGAERVLLTDYVDAVLCNLRDCMHLNADSSSLSGDAASGSSPAGAAAVATGSTGTAGGKEAATAAVTAATVDAEEWDPEDASECGSDDFDALLSEAAGAGANSSQQQQQRAPAAWDAAPMHVRFCDWQESVERLDELDRIALVGAVGDSGTADTASIDKGGNDSGVPGIDAAEQFDVIIGTDILYEWPMVEMVPAVLKHRLRPGGRALLCCAVREQAMFDACAAGLRALGLRVGITQVQPQADDAGLLDIRQDYEGGYVLIAAEHANAPASDWHRSDLFGSA